MNASVDELEMKNNFVSRLKSLAFCIVYVTIKMKGIPQRHSYVATRKGDGDDENQI